MSAFIPKNSIQHGTPSRDRQKKAMILLVTLQAAVRGKPYRFWVRRRFSKAKMRPYSRGRPSLGSQGLVRQLLSPRYLAKRSRAARSAGVSTCPASPQHLEQILNENVNLPRIPSTFCADFEGECPPAPHPLQHFAQISNENVNLPRIISRSCAKCEGSVNNLLRIPQTFCMHF